MHAVGFETERVGIKRNALDADRAIELCASCLCSAICRMNGGAAKKPSKPITMNAISNPMTMRRVRRALGYRLRPLSRFRPAEAREVLVSLPLRAS